MTGKIYDGDGSNHVTAYSWSIDWGQIRLLSQVLHVEAHMLPEETILLSDAATNGSTRSELDADDSSRFTSVEPRLGKEAA